MRLFLDTYSELEPAMREIVSTVRTLPPRLRPGTLHIDRMEAIGQYAFYVALVREWLPNRSASILDWGGQHGQVTKLLSHYYPDTTCYALLNDAFDRRYGLEEWHQRLGIRKVIRSSRPDRLEVPQRYDAVISSGVLEHVRESGVDEVQMVQELHRVLKPGGLLFIWNLPRYWGREVLYPLFRRATHLRRYRKRELSRVLVGFEIRYLSTHEILPLAAVKRLSSVLRPERLLQLDYGAAERLPWLAQNFTVVAERMMHVPRSGAPHPTPAGVPARWQ